MEVEVMFVTQARTASHRYPAIVTYEDGPLVRGLLKAGHVVLINPPHLPGFNDNELPEPMEPGPEAVPEPDNPKRLMTNENQEKLSRSRIRRQERNEDLYQ